MNNNCLSPKKIIIADINKPNIINISKLKNRIRNNNIIKIYSRHNNAYKYDNSIEINNKKVINNTILLLKNNLRNKFKYANSIDDKHNNTNYSNIISKSNDIIYYNKLDLSIKKTNITYKKYNNNLFFRKLNTKKIKNKVNTNINMSKNKPNNIVIKFKKSLIKQLSKYNYNLKTDSEKLLIKLKKDIKIKNN